MRHTVITMFCPSCGDLAYIREGDGKSYYKRIESSINPYRQEYENDKPKMEDYNPEDLSRKIPREDEITLVDAPVSTDTPRRKTDYQIDYDEWKALDEVVPRVHNVDKGEEIEKEGVKYSTCNNPSCNYNGPAAKVKKDGKEIDFDDLNSKSVVENRDYTPIKDSEGIPGVLTRGDYICPRCDCTEVYADVNSSLEFGETSAKMLTCKKCGHGWREF